MVANIHKNNLRLLIFIIKIFRIFNLITCFAWIVNNPKQSQIIKNLRKSLYLEKRN
jgi:hypothetical protein